MCSESLLDIPLDTSEACQYDQKVRGRRNVGNIGQEILYEERARTCPAWREEG